MGLSIRDISQKQQGYSVSVQQRADGHIRVRIHKPSHVVAEGTKMPAGKGAGNLAPSLVYSDEFQDDRRGYGGMPRRTSFSRHAKRLISEAASALEQIHSKVKIRFLTGTLPGSTDESFKAIARYSAYIVARISQWLRDMDEHIEFCGVWELQKRGALHFHMVVGHKDKTIISRVEREWKPFWIDLLLQVSEKTGVDLFQREDGGTWQANLDIVRATAEEIRKSVGRYLSKYLTKGSGQLSDSTYAPTRWWCLSRRLRQTAYAQRKVILLAVPSLKDAIGLADRMYAVLIKCNAVIFDVINPIDSSLIGYSGWGEVDWNAFESILLSPELDGMLVGPVLPPMPLTSMLLTLR